MDLAAKRRSGKGVFQVRGGWWGLVGPRPGGRRDGLMIRFAESDSDSEICRFSSLCLTQPLARKGLAVFNRSAHSAWPAVGNGQ